MTIGVLDSGIGGVAVMKELLRLPQKNRYVYFADNRYAPYGSLNETVLTLRATEIARTLLDCGAEAVLLLCNTATTVALEKLRSTLSVPVFGVRPNIAARAEKTLVLSTMLTAQRLLKERSEFGNAEILGLRSLSLEIEDAAPDFSSLRPYLAALLAPYRSYRTVYLACTHYIHLAPYIRELLPKAELRSGIEPLLESVAALGNSRGEIAAATDKSPFCGGCGLESRDAEIEFIFSGENKEKLYREVLFGR